MNLDINKRKDKDSKSNSFKS